MGALSVSKEAFVLCLPPSEIRQDGETQHRTRANELVISRYAELMAEGTVFPPLKVWFDGVDYWLSDGFHRLAAADKAGITSIRCEVHLGSVDDARWDSYSANGDHGLKLTALEAKRVVQNALLHARSAHLSNMEISRHLSVSEPRYVVGARSYQRVVMGKQLDSLLGAKRHIL